LPVPTSARQLVRRHHPHDDLREVVAGVLGLAERPEPALVRFFLAAGRDPLAPLVAGNVRILLLRLEIRAGGVSFYRLIR
jgi:hypothetical protein